jgi:hypothetical protein
MYALARARTTRTVIALPSGRFLLGALTPDQAAEQVFPQSSVKGSAGQNSATRAGIVSSAGAGQMVLPDNTTVLAYSSAQSGCQGVNLIKPALTNMASGLALKFVPAAFAAGPVVGGVVLAIAGITKIFGAIFSHHAQAVARERSALCAAVPAANQSIELIDQMVQSGQSTPQQGMDAVDSVLTGFRQAVDAIIKGSDPTSGQCNAACVMLSQLRAIVLLKKSQYQDLQSSEASSITGRVATALASGNLSDLLPWAAAGLGLFLILREG